MDLGEAGRDAGALQAGEPGLSIAARTGRRVAVCVCTADRPLPLWRLLTALEAAERPAGCELLLVVVDNRPGGAAADLVGLARPRLPFAVLLETEATPGTSFARNRAVAAALRHGADLVAFVDDDDVPRPDWLVRLIEARDASGADLVFGCHGPSPDMPLPKWLRGVNHFARKPLPALSVFGIPAGASSSNVLLTRRLLADLAAEGPPFRPEFARVGGEDTDLFVRAARRGYAYVVCPESEVCADWPPERLTWGGLTRRSFRYGVARWRLRLAHASPGSRPAELRRVGRALARQAWRLAGSVGRRGRLARSWFGLTEQLGEAYALLGGSYAYYGTTRPGPTAAAPEPGLPDRSRPRPPRR